MPISSVSAENDQFTAPYPHYPPCAPSSWSSWPQPSSPPAVILNGPASYSGFYNGNTEYYSFDGTGFINGLSASTLPEANGLSAQKVWGSATLGVVDDRTPYIVMIAAGSASGLLTVDTQVAVQFDFSVEGASGEIPFYIQGELTTSNGFYYTGAALFNATGGSGLTAFLGKDGDGNVIPAGSEVTAWRLVIGAGSFGSSDGPQNLTLNIPANSIELVAFTGGATPPPSSEAPNPPPSPSPQSASPSYSCADCAILYEVKPALLLLLAFAAAAQPIIIRGGTLIDGTARKADVLLQHGRIEAIGPDLKAPADAILVRADGRSILPGLFDLHTHVPYATVGGSTQDWGKNLKAYLRAGVTSVADFGTYPETYEPIRRLLAQGTWKGPRVHFAARFSTPGGHGVEGGRGDLFTNEVLTPRQAHAAMARVLPYKPEIIKVFTDGWRYATAPDMTSMELDTLKAIVADAHKANLPVLTHTVTLAKAKIAARAGVDAIMHGIQNLPVDDELIQLMKANNVAYGPTAAVYEPRAGYINEPLLEQLLQPAALDALRNRPMLATPSAQRVRKYELLRQNVAALHKAGITIVAGTDAGIVGTHHGWATLREIKLLSSAGLGPMGALKAATANAAKVLRSTNRGTLDIGNLADLLIVNGRPDLDINVIDKVEMVYQGGHAVDLVGLSVAIRADGPTPTPAKQAPALLDDFEAPNGRSRLDTRWVNSTDTGHDRTTMLYQRIARGPNNRALSVTADLSDSSSPYARINLPLTRGAVEPMDARAFAGVEFEARGEGPYNLRIQKAKASFEAGPNWSTVRIPFDTSLDLSRLQLLTFEIARPGGQRAWLELDNIRFYKPESAALFEEEIPASRKHREETYAQFQRFADRLEKDQDKEKRRREFISRLGYPPPGFTGPYQERMERIGEDAIATYYRAWVPVAPGMEVYGLYLVPKNVRLPAPLVIAKHGGGGYPELAIFKGGGNYHDMIRGAARQGYVVWAPITLMHPFRDRDAGTPIPIEVRRDMDARFRKLGTSLMGVETMRISRSLDVIIRRPEVDPQRVGMIGLSYGGYFTLYTMALDPRIKVGIASCSFRDREAMRAEMPEGKAPEGRPFDMTGPDLVSLIAPRALQLQNGVSDKGLPIDMVRRAAAEAKSHYAPNGAFEFQEFDGGHEWRGDIAWAFLRKHL